MLLLRRSKNSASGPINISDSWYPNAPKFIVIRIVLQWIAAYLIGIAFVCEIRQPTSTSWRFYTNTFAIRLRDPTTLQCAWSLCLKTAFIIWRITVTISVQTKLSWWLTFSWFHTWTIAVLRVLVCWTISCGRVKTTKNFIWIVFTIVCYVKTIWTSFF